MLINLSHQGIHLFPLEAIYKVPTAGWLQIFALAGALEAKNVAFPTCLDVAVDNLQKCGGGDRSWSLGLGKKICHFFLKVMIAGFDRNCDDCG